MLTSLKQSYFPFKSLFFFPSPFWGIQFDVVYRLYEFYTLTFSVLARVIAGFCYVEVLLLVPRILLVFGVDHYTIRN